MRANVNTAPLSRSSPGMTPPRSPERPRPGSGMSLHRSMPAQSSRRLQFDQMAPHYDQDQGQGQGQGVSAMSARLQPQPQPRSPPMQSQPIQPAVHHLASPLRRQSSRSSLTDSVQVPFHLLMALRDVNAASGSSALESLQRLMRDHEETLSQEDVHVDVRIDLDGVGDASNMGANASLSRSPTVMMEMEQPDAEEQNVNSLLAALNERDLPSPAPAPAIPPSPRPSKPAHPASPVAGDEEGHHVVDVDVIGEGELESEEPGSGSSLSDDPDRENANLDADQDQELDLEAFAAAENAEVDVTDDEEGYGQGEGEGEGEGESGRGPVSSSSSSEEEDYGFDD